MLYGHLDRSCEPSHVRGRNALRVSGLRPSAEGRDGLRHQWIVSGIRMNVFFSWPGERSRAVPTALRDWLPDVLRHTRARGCLKTIFGEIHVLGTIFWLCC